MAEAKAAAIPDKKEKSSILDDDTGKDILNSWKSISGTEGAVDFKLEPIGKSKKKDFSFENLDMDFDLVSDFGKISSFKMDMSDLDFSFSPKKNKKAIEKKGDSGSVNFQGKEDRFNFSFDFNSLGNFDIDAPMSKVDTLSRKQKDSQKLDIDRTDCQVSEIQVNEVTIADIVNKPKRGQASETVAATKVHVYDTLMTDNHPLRSEVSDDIVLQPEVEISSDKADRKGREDTANHSNIPVYQHIIQNFDVQSNPTKNKGEGNLMESLKEGYSSDTGVKTNVEGEQSICYNELVALEAVHEKTPECAPPRIAEPLEDNSKRNKILSYCNGKEPSIYIEDVVERGSNLGRSPKIVQSKTSELSKDGSIIANTFADVKESSDGVFDSHDTSVARAVKIVHREIKTQLSPLSNRESMVNKSTSGNEKETNIVQSKFFSRSDETDRLNHEASFFIKPKYVKMQTVHSDSPSEIREPNACEKQIGISAGADFVSNKKVAKGENTLLRNQRTLITAKEISSSNSKEKSSKKESQKSEKTSIASIMDCTQSIRHISTAKDNPLPLKSVTRSLDLTDLKSSRGIEEKKLQPIFATTKEIKSLKVLKQKVHENVPPKVTSLNLTEKRKPGTPTLKRKQAPTGGLVLEIPLKRLSQSPRDSSKNVSDMKMKEQVQHQNNTVNINTRDHLVDMPRIPKFDTPGQMNSSIVETEMGNYGIVEKAEAYGKDLDDLCNMLKKKHEEAKELLVRAVINNNNLLLLNHPMHNEKIRSVQKLANRLMAMEIIPHPNWIRAKEAKGIGNQYEYASSNNTQV